MEDIKKQSKSGDSIEDFINFSFRAPQAVDGINAADKLFFHGKILPCKPNTPPPRSAAALSKKVSPLRNRGSESPGSPDLRRFRETSAGDYRRLRMASPEWTPEMSGGKLSKRPPCVLGVVRLPAEMEMKDIKTRQRRIGAQPLMSERRRRGFLNWGLESLSCKATESTAVTPVSAAR